MNLTRRPYRIAQDTGMIEYDDSFPVPDPTPDELYQMEKDKEYAEEEAYQEYLDQLAEEDESHRLLDSYTDEEIADFMD